VNSIVINNTDFNYEIPAGILSNIYDLLSLRVQKDEGYVPVQESFKRTDVFFDSIIMDAHRTIKEQNQQNGATKITCCGVE
ncbi:hypothetical protein V3G70_29840, partial [Escherichia coli]